MSCLFSENIHASPKIHQGLHLSASGVLYVELLFCICLSYLPDTANLYHHIHAAILPAEEGAQITPNFAFGYAIPQGHQKQHEGGLHSNQVTLGNF